ncbi:hypothetical protein [Mucilaginibacter sp.]
MSNRLYFFLLIAGLLANGCAQEAGKPASVATVPQASQKPSLMDPFRFHKLIEVAPGNDFDILSWGRGSTETGSFIILHSDSVNMKYSTTTGDLDGVVVDAFNTDMDVDGNPEILIQAKTKDSVYNTTIYAFEFDNGKANKLDFPKLSSSQKKGYRGNDSFYVQDGNLMRQFALYDGTGKDAKPNGQKRLLQYGIRNNEFTVKQISKDSTDTKAVGPFAATPLKKSTESKHSKYSDSKSIKKSSKKKKHKTEERHASRKKRKKHHQSD